MKKKNIFIFALTLMMTLFMSLGSVSTAFAADDDNNYEVRIYPGLKGTYQGSSDVTILNKQLGDDVYITIDDVSVTDDRYYPRGFRIAGHDNDEMEGETVTGFTRMNFDVKEDVNYVVAYGIKGEMVPYTVKYIDESTGKTLLSEETFYGMPGDKPVVSYRYIDGYQPHVYNIAKRLTRNASDNVFEFRYTKAADTQNTETVRRVVAAAPGTAANPAGTNAGAPAAGANAANNGAATIGDNSTPLSDGPQQFTDLDGNETPLANGSEGEGHGILPFIIGGVALLALILALIVYLLSRRHREEEE